VGRPEQSRFADPGAGTQGPGCGVRQARRHGYEQIEAVTGRGDSTIYQTDFERRGWVEPRSLRVVQSEAQRGSGPYPIRPFGLRSPARLYSIGDKQTSLQSG